MKFKFSLTEKSVLSKVTTKNQKKKAATLVRKENKENANYANKNFVQVLSVEPDTHDGIIKQESSKCHSELGDINTSLSEEVSACSLIP